MGDARAGGGRDPVGPFPCRIVSDRAEDRTKSPVRLFQTRKAFHRNQARHAYAAEGCTSTRRAVPHKKRQSSGFFLEAAGPHRECNHQRAQERAVGHRCRPTQSPGEEKPIGPILPPSATVPINGHGSGYHNKSGTDEVPDRGARRGRLSCARLPKRDRECEQSNPNAP